LVAIIIAVDYLIILISNLTSEVSVSTHIVTYLLLLSSQSTHEMNEMKVQ